MDHIQDRQMQIRPEREALFSSCYKAMGYRLEDAKRADHMDTQLTFRSEDPNAMDPERKNKAEALLAKLLEIDQRVTRYYLQLVCLVGMIGAACIGCSFIALKADLHILFTLLLLIGIFGCTITLYLRPLFTRWGMRKYGTEEPALIAELEELLGIGGEEA